MDTRKSLEVTGKTPEDAIAKGLTQLGLDTSKELCALERIVQHPDLAEFEPTDELA